MIAIIVLYCLACLHTTRMSANPDDEAVAAAAAVCAAAITLIASTYQLNREPFNTSSLTGLEWVFELLAGNERRMRNTFGITPAVFMRLVKALHDHAGITDSKYVSAEEKLAMFLYACRTGASTRVLEDRFQNSTATVSKSGQIFLFLLFACSPILL